MRANWFRIFNSISDRTTTNLTTPDQGNSPSPQSVLGQLSDAQLAERAGNGSLPAFAELVARFEKRLYNFLRRRVGNDEDAEDLTQESFLRAWRHVSSYNPRWAFSTWLFTIAGRLATNHHRTAVRRPRGGAGPALDDTAGEVADPAAIAARAEQHANIWWTAERVLSAEQQSALWLRYAEQMQIREVARVLGRSGVSVRVMLHRARQTLAQDMETADRPATARPGGRTLPTPGVVDSIRLAASAGVSGEAP